MPARRYGRRRLGGQRVAPVEARHLLPGGEHGGFTNAAGSAGPKEQPAGSAVPKPSSWRWSSGGIVRMPSPIADCADLWIVPTLTRHALRSGRFLPATSAQSCPGARLHSCASARLRAGFACCYPDPRRRDWSESAGTDEVSPCVSCALLRTSTRDASVRFRTPRVRPVGLWRPRRPVSLFCRGVHERRRHNLQVATTPTMRTSPTVGEGGEVQA